MALSNQDKQKYNKLYIQTARNYLENMRTSLSKLIKDQDILETVKQVHIDAHSLKSQSQMMGHQHIAKISEIIEHLFNKSEQDDIHIPQKILIILQSDVTRLLDSLDEIEANGKELDLTDRVEELEKIK